MVMTNGDVMDYLWNIHGYHIMECWGLRISAFRIHLFGSSKALAVLRVRERKNDCVVVEAAYVYAYMYTYYCLESG
jgi:hypothetical protein